MIFLIIRIRLVLPLLTFLPLFTTIFFFIRLKVSPNLRHHRKRLMNLLFQQFILILELIILEVNILQFVLRLLVQAHIFLFEFGLLVQSMDES